MSETWDQNLDKVLTPGEPLPFSNDEEGKIQDNPLNPYDANKELRSVKAQSHPKTQRAGVRRGSGPPGGQRNPGGTRQGTSSVK